MGYCRRCGTPTHEDRHSNPQECVDGLLSLVVTMSDAARALRAALEKADAMADLLSTTDSLAYDFVHVTGSDVEISATPSQKAVAAVAAYRDARGKVER